MWQIIPKLRDLKATLLAPDSIIWTELSWTAGLCPMWCKQDGSMHLRPAGNCKAPEILGVFILKSGTLARLVEIAMGFMNFFHYCWYFFLHVWLPMWPCTLKESGPDFLLRHATLTTFSESHSHSSCTTHLHQMGDPKFLGRKMIPSFATELVMSLLARKGSCLQILALPLKTHVHRV